MPNKLQASGNGARIVLGTTPYMKSIMNVADTWAHHTKSNQMPDEDDPSILLRTYTVQYGGDQPQTTSAIGCQQLK